MSLSKRINTYFLLTVLVYLSTLCLITRYMPSFNHDLSVNCSIWRDLMARIDTALVSANSIDVTLTEQDFTDQDVLALLHVQKTSGSAWEMHIFKNLEVNFGRYGWRGACVYVDKHKRYICLRNQYNKQLYWDRYTSRFCDMHADYTELKNCLMFDYKNRIMSRTIHPAIQGIAHIITFLRDPIHRYISEYEHVKREGATWYNAIRSCQDQALYANKCKWENDVSLEAFVSCEHNLANNRQTRMLANYNLLGCNVLKCWTRSSNCSPQVKASYERKILQSAKHTLMSLPYFGLTELQQESEYLFLKTFNENKFRFKTPVQTVNQTRAKSTLESGNVAKYVQQIEENNHLDIELYEFAKKLFLKRLFIFNNLIIKK